MTYTDPLASPPRHDPAPGWGQSLSTGAAGIALLHIEYAHAGIGGWDTVHQWAAAMTRCPVVAHPDACGLFRGAPAVAFVLSAAERPGYATALSNLDSHITRLTRYRLQQAHERIERGQLPTLREYDLINGLTGIGVYLLHQHGKGDLLWDILSYLVRLAEPLTVDDQTLPGWWTGNGPADQPSRDWPGGHANLGLAHGIAGPLALLASAMTFGITVPGHAEAIEGICAWLDQWRCGTRYRPWWPGMISQREWKARTVQQPGPQRPSWCYGTPGLARALQLAALALANTQRLRLAEDALAGCIADDTQLAQLDDASLCHGWAGLVQTTRRVAADAGPGSALATLLPHLYTRWEHDQHRHQLPTSDGMLEGTAGITLTRHTAADALPASRWDVCLLIAPPTCLEKPHPEGTQ
ncbi:MAG: lanthionine synthetase C family protein [Pseudonocardiaceae bacterium]